MKTVELLTVDWDAFIPEPLEADMGHQENLLFRETLWQTLGRSWLQPIMRPSRHAKNIWPNVKLPRVSNRFISDSHLHAFDIVAGKKVNKVTLVDQHHDLWPMDTLGDRIDIHCGNWLTSAVELHGLHEIDWYLPSFSHCNPYDNCNHEQWGRIVEWGDRHEVAINVYPIADFMTDGPHKPDYVHVCRSSCWTPPWCDPAFKEFTEPLGVCNIQKPDKASKDWNPLDLRHFPKDDSEAFGQLLGADKVNLMEEEREKQVARIQKWIAECGEHDEPYILMGKLAVQRGYGKFRNRRE